MSSPLRWKRLRVLGAQEIASYAPGNPVLVQRYAMLKWTPLYTGVTQDRRLVVLVGQKKAVAIAVRIPPGRGRWSKLDEWLAGTSAGTEIGIFRDARSLQEWPLTGAMPYG